MCNSLGHLEPILLSDAPAEHQGGTVTDFEQRPDVPDEPQNTDPGTHTPLPERQHTCQLYVASAEASQKLQQEVQQQGAPQLGRWAALGSDAAQHAEGITGSGRKRARHSISAAASSSAGEGMAELFPAHHTAPLPASALEDEQPDAPHHRQLSNNHDQHIAMETEMTLAVARARAPGDCPSPGSSASDDLVSPPSEQHRQAALVAARAVAQAMGMQARHHDDIQVCSWCCDYSSMAPCHTCVSQSCHCAGPLP